MDLLAPVITRTSRDIVAYDRASLDRDITSTVGDMIEIAPLVNPKGLLISRLQDTVARVEFYDAVPFGSIQERDCRPIS